MTEIEQKKTEALETWIAMRVIERDATAHREQVHIVYTKRVCGETSY